ncbi:UDP-N-acetylmuramate--L-alanine ligase [Actinomyces sp. MRS3W]|uniref:UDP-N-acetylmuramate--L-alanine ligase n=1 Tax=Actinomyces sp. MRS3W TaxID=2800796 RepID=UPI0028FDA2A6|nr:UDP-N-acetylmuramate--L-alanine ligase [Actinomyces sp. MRS3W]MDU0347886.1 UDP-N-acetylmuramate--L-alanine ligase [Actinomyces sp. MRS3W]
MTPDRTSIPPADDLAGRAFHLIGIGGAGMSVVAEILAERGAVVTGSDAGGGDAFDRLREMGLTVHLGHDAANVPADATVVVSTAIKDTNPELRAARRRGQPVMHRSEALALAARGRDFVAVAGAHGKTTTSGMLAHALTAVGQDPSFAIGGVVRSLNTGARVGAGPAFVAEADESDRSFLNYEPALEIVTNIEPDHLDNYGTAAAFAQAFVDFTARLRPGGRLIVCADDAGALRLAHAAAARGTAVTTYGTCSPQLREDGGLVGDAHVQVEILDRRATGTSARLTRWRQTDEGGSRPVRPENCELLGPVALELSLPGDHVALDAAGAWAAGLELGVEPEAMAQALGSFAGTGRRFEARGEVGGVRVIDDYAHHPTEIVALLAAAREVADARGGRVIALFQPHLFSRTRNFADRFGAALAGADQTIVTAIYPARERQEDFPDVTGQCITDQIPAHARYIADAHAAALAAAADARPGDLILTIGAGDVTRLGAVILEALAERGATDTPR